MNRRTKKGFEGREIQPEPIEEDDDSYHEEDDDAPENKNPYLRQVTVTNGPDKGHMFMVDIYDVVDAFAIDGMAAQQAAKKLLRGGRSDKDWVRDMEECIKSLQRAIERKKVNMENC